MEALPRRKDCVHTYPAALGRAVVKGLNTLILLTILVVLRDTFCSSVDNNQA